MHNPNLKLIVGARINNIYVQVLDFSQFFIKFVNDTSDSSQLRDQ